MKVILEPLLEEFLRSKQIYKLFVDNVKCDPEQRQHKEVYVATFMSGFVFMTSKEGVHFWSRVIPQWYKFKGQQ